ncbi:MAG: metal ABC transporter permease [Ruminococcaceae bacterium]|nr:metal ABC transporter permease [Oscillospiraceae bacterium]
MNKLALIGEYLSYDFVVYAFVVGILIALCAGLFGVVLVLKRFSFIGDGLSHVAFGAMAVATVLGVTDNLIFVLPVTVLSAVLLLCVGKNRKIKGDAAIAMISVGALAIGYMLMSVFSTSANVAGDVCSTLFGSFSIVTLTLADVWICVIASAVVLTVFILFYNRIFAVTFDEGFSRASGVWTAMYNLLVAVVIALIIVLAMELVGSLLISALVVFPALAAMRVCKSFRGVTVTAACISVACAAFGILASIVLSTPVGPTVVVADMLAFGVCFTVGAVVRRG